MIVRHSALVCGALVALVIGGGLANAQSVTVALVPDSIAAGVADTSGVQIVIRNGTNEAISGLRVSAPALSGWQFSFDADGQALQKNGALVRILRLKAIDTTKPLPASVPIRLDYVLGAGVSAAPGVAHATLRFVPGRYARAEDVADVQLATSLSYLAEGKEGLIHLLVRNKTGLELAVSTPDFAKLPGAIISRDETRLRENVLRVAPYSSGVYPLRIRAESRVRPGKHMFVATVPLVWTDDRKSSSGNVVLSKEIEVGVFGESELLRVLSVPSLWILPGFLMLLTISVWYQNAPELGRAKGTEFRYKIASPEFWAIALGLSMVVALASFVVLGSWAFVDYGFRDVIILWFASVFLGSVSYLGWRRLRNVRFRRNEQAERDKQEAEEKKRELQTPTAGDDPIALLNRLGHRRLSVPRRAYRDAPTGRLLFPLFEAAEAGRIWVAPPIMVKWNDSSGDSTKAEALDVALESGDPAQIASEISRLGGLISATWIRTGNARLSTIERPTDGPDQDAQFIQVDT